MQGFQRQLLWPSTSKCYWFNQLNPHRQAVIDLTSAIEADGTQTLYLSNRGPAPKGNLGTCCWVAKLGEFDGKHMQKCKTKCWNSCCQFAESWRQCLFEQGLYDRAEVGARAWTVRRRSQFRYKIFGHSTTIAYHSCNLDMCTCTFAFYTYSKALVGWFFIVYYTIQSIQWIYEQYMGLS